MPEPTAIDIWDGRRQDNRRSIKLGLFRDRIIARPQSACIRPFRNSVDDDDAAVEFRLLDCREIAGPEEAVMSALSTLIRFTSPSKAETARRKRGLIPGKEETPVLIVECLPDNERPERRNCRRRRRNAGLQNARTNRGINSGRVALSELDTEEIRRTGIGRDIARPEPSGIGSFIELRPDKDSPIKFRLLRCRIVSGKKPGLIRAFGNLLA